MDKPLSNSDWARRAVALLLARLALLIKRGVHL